MITIQMKCSYEEFNGIKIILEEMIPFALVRIDYTASSNLATFTFWDSNYVPERLRMKALKIPGNEKLMAQVNDEINARF